MSRNTQHQVPRWSRRGFITATSLAAAATACHTISSRTGIIDCHTHFYDPTRPQGVPWPAANEQELYRTVLPADYKQLAQPLGVTGTVVVEASPWVIDNDWVLALADKEPFIRGLVGNVRPGTANFRADIIRLAKNQLFRGIRLRDTNSRELYDARVIPDVELLAERDLALDINGGPELLSSIALLAGRLPELRIIIDHVANVRVDGGPPPQDWIDGMNLVAPHPNVFCKVSGLVEGTGRRHAAPSNLDFYRPVLDHVWRCFGPDRLVYGSNWPVSALFADLRTVQSIAHGYFAELGEAIVQKVFARNARLFYKVK